MLTPAELYRYQRQLGLPEFGTQAQERLKGGRVLVIGAGGLGCPALIYLAAAGVGHITLLDPDFVDGSNLHRQILYDDADIGEPKALVAARRLRERNPLIAVTALPERLGRDNALELVRGSDVVIDGSDNFATRYLVNDACVMTDRPFVYGGIQGFDGQLSVFNLRGGPTYRCLFPSPPPPDLAPSCAEAGVLGVLPGVIGTCQATEAIKILSGIGETLSGRLLLWNALTMSMRAFAIAPDPRSRPIVELPPDGEAQACRAPGWEVTVGAVQSMLRAGGVQLLDVREDWERARDAILPSTHLPLAVLEQTEADAPIPALAALRPDRPVVVYCAAGVRSLRAVGLLRSRYGFPSAQSLRGGLAAWRAVAPSS